MIIPKEEFKTSLVQNINFQNWLGFDDEKTKEIHTDEVILQKVNQINQSGNVPEGFYITDFFLKNNDGDTQPTNYKFANLYEDTTNLVEKLSINNNNTSSAIQNLNRNVSTVVKQSMSVTTAENDQNIGYFFMAFPIIVESNILIILLTFLDLPFDLEFSFSKTNSNKNTTASLLVNEQRLGNYDVFIQKGLKNISNNCLSTRIFKVIKKEASYTDFLKELYNKNFSSFQEMTSSITFQGFEMNLLNNHIISFKLTGAEDKIINIIQSQPNLGRNITYHKEEKDARKMYWRNCIDNEATINPDTQKNKLSNYFDIAFDCRYLKAFSFSNYAPGFNVINYQPTEIYKSMQLQKNLNGVINLFEVYKDVFTRKIIEFEAQLVL